MTIPFKSISFRFDQHTNKSPQLTNRSKKKKKKPSKSAGIIFLFISKKKMLEQWLCRDIEFYAYFIFCLNFFDVVAVVVVDIPVWMLCNASVTLVDTRTLANNIGIWRQLFFFLLRCFRGMLRLDGLFLSLITPIISSLCLVWARFFNLKVKWWAAAWKLRFLKKFTHLIHGWRYLSFDSKVKFLTSRSFRSVNS